MKLQKIDNLKYKTICMIFSTKYKFIWLFSCLAVYMITTACVTSDRYRSLLKLYETDTKALRDVADNLSVKKNELEANLQKCELQNKILSSDLESQKEKYQTTIRLSDEIKKDLEKFVKTHEGSYIGPSDQLVIQDKILFDSGKASLKDEGKNVLDDFVTNVIKGKDLYLKIIGHTDSDPIVKTAGTWKTGLNHELGGARALTVLEYLSKKGINTKNMHYESYGENKPIAENDTKSNKAKNRRVEIYIIEKK